MADVPGLRKLSTRGRERGGGRRQRDSRQPRLENDPGAPDLTLDRPAPETLLRTRPAVDRERAPVQVELQPPGVVEGDGVQVRPEVGGRLGLGEPPFGAGEDRQGGGQVLFPNEHVDVVHQAGAEVAVVEEYEGRTLQQEGADPRALEQAAVCRQVIETLSPATLERSEMEGLFPEGEGPPLAPESRKEIDGVVLILSADS